jgi:hypothetical protein
VQHATPNCESHQDYKGIFSDRSLAFLTENFRTKLKTNAFKSNNILLSDKATINAKPQLEIFADDVNAHGCTIGQPDETAMFYMQQRGTLRKKPALLMYAFKCGYRKHQNTRIKTTNQLSLLNWRKMGFVVLNTKFLIFYILVVFINVILNITNYCN